MERLLRPTFCSEAALLIAALKISFLSASFAMQYLSFEFVEYYATLSQDSEKSEELSSWLGNTIVVFRAWTRPLNRRFFFNIRQRPPSGGGSGAARRGRAGPVEPAWLQTAAIPFAPGLCFMV